MKIKLLSYKWRRWFAWRPIVTEDSVLVWLRLVERRIFDCDMPNVVPQSWIIYRLPKEGLYE